MTELHVCPACTHTLSADAPAGLCPKCLMGAALPEMPTGGALGNDASNSSPQPNPPLQEFGGCDGVLTDPQWSPRQAEYPPPPPIDFKQFQLAVVESGLVAPDELDKFVAPAQGDVPYLARALVKAKMLTLYQAEAVKQGKARGLVIGDYVVLDKLGKGGQATVFEARQRQQDKLVALKLLPPSFADDPRKLSRFSEVEAASKVNHPNIVAAYHADWDRNVPYLVMEYIDGPDLDRLVSEDGPLRVGARLIT